MTATKVFEVQVSGTYSAVYEVTAHNEIEALEKWRDGALLTDDPSKLEAESAVFSYDEADLNLDDDYDLEGDDDDIDYD